MLPSRFAYEEVGLQNMHQASSSLYQISQEGQQNTAFNTGSRIGYPPVQQQSGHWYSQDNERNFHHQSAPWEPGVWRRFPVLPMLSLLIVLACMSLSHM